MDGFWIILAVAVVVSIGLLALGSIIGRMLGRASQDLPEPEDVPPTRNVQLLRVITLTNGPDSMYRVEAAWDPIPVADGAEAQTVLHRLYQDNQWGGEDGWPHVIVLPYPERAWRDWVSMDGRHFFSTKTEG